MSDEVQNQTQQIVEVIQREDDANVQRFNEVNGKLDTIALQVQSDGTSETVTIDGEQWDSMVTSLGTIADTVSLTLYLTLVSVCVVSAILGTRLFAVFTDGWRR